MTESPPLLLLDGSAETELARRGFEIRGDAWSAPAIWREPALLARIHEEQARAGADVITANTSRTQRRALSRIGEGRRAHEWTLEAVRIALDAAHRVSEEQSDGRPIRIAGSIASLEGAPGPEVAPDETSALAEHREHVGDLVDADVDVLLVEAMTTIGESRAATVAATETGLETWTSVATDASGLRVMSGEPLESWVEALAPLRPRGLLVSVAAAVALPGVRSIAPLAAAIGALPGAYEDLLAGESRPTGRVGAALTPEELVAATKPVIDVGARIVGGRSMTPEHVRALRTLLDERLAEEAATRDAADPSWRSLVRSAAEMAGGGRALVVGEGDPSVLGLELYEVARPSRDELAMVPAGGFRLAVVDDGDRLLPDVVRALKPGGWLAMRVLGDATGGPLAVRLDGLDVREVRSNGDAALILARRSI